MAKPVALVFLSIYFMEDNNIRLRMSIYLLRKILGVFFSNLPLLLWVWNNPVEILNK